MEQYLLEAFRSGKDSLRNKLLDKHPDNYGELVKWTIEAISNHCEIYDIDEERITVIDYGDYQGTLVYVIAGKGYQPWIHWVTKVSYGSCSGCDVLESIRSSCSYYDDDYNVAKPSPQQVEDYLTLALHIVENMKEV